ncbi:MAG: hypothetical protein JO085_10490 [Acidimicrobiia bacterium]|nr:hypothetical protein [Solirubrobacterales bacterium]MBV8297255.1 hypothetical protein [Acidimicrobiia bacterium]
MVAELRAEVAGSEDLGELDLVAAGDSELETKRRQARYLKVFYEAPGLSLHKDQARGAAVAAGYDNRGTAGFYVGDGCLVRVGDQRVLTPVGKAWYEANRDVIDDEDD